jgi:transcription elongation factor GreA
MQTVQLTKEGLEKLKAELKELLDNKRPEVAKRIQTARENGDISENAEYDAARLEQSTVEKRIEELEDIVRHAQVSDTKTDKGVVGLGAKVTVHIDGDEDTFHLVGAPEANPLERKISHESPLGVAMVGKKVGEKIEVDAPVGKLIYTIKRIDY